jgi:hypothetical protein
VNPRSHTHALSRLSCITDTKFSLGRHPDTYDHTFQRTRDPVRSPMYKLERAGSVVGWVTTSESPVLYVYFFGLFLFG